ncbi:hypothetical protein LOD99_4924 [Oopsacas minuta]|uniref:Meiosis-specific with OB domain-containing protein n=1 Tax=Oopsacas minuta TaxID=111878 RepID=A0AAV7JSI8_9METZ|nr:hypothetical protein LOD99_4924 [Oopsacas minuta]
MKRDLDAAFANEVAIQIPNMTIQDLVANQDCNIIGLVIGKTQTKRFQDKKNPECMRWKLQFTIRDSPTELINGTAWGTEEYITKLSSLFQINDTIELTCCHVQLKPPNVDEKWCPATSSQYHLSMNEPNSTIRQYRGNGYIEIAALANLPLHAPGQHSSIGEIAALGSNANGQSVNILAAVKQVKQPVSFVTRDGRNVQRCEVKLFDHTCEEFELTIWDSEFITLAKNWVSRENILSIINAKLVYNNYKNKVAAKCDATTLIVTNPSSEEAHNLYRHAQTVNISLEVEEEFIKKTFEPERMSIYDFIESKANGNNFNAEILCCITEINLSDSSRIKPVCMRCRECKTRLTSFTCSNSYCPVYMKLGIDPELTFDIFVNLTDHTGSLNNVKLSQKCCMDILSYEPKDIDKMKAKQLNDLKKSLVLERMRVSVMYKPWQQEKDRSRSLVLSCIPADLNDLITYSKLN